MNKKKKSSVGRTISKARAPKSDNALQSLPYMKSDITALADEMLGYYMGNDTHHINAFPLSKRYPTKRFFALSHDHEYFADAVQTVKDICALRILEDWKAHKLEKDYAFALLPLYDEKHREWQLQKRSAFGKEMAQRAEVTTVFVEATPNSPLVPIKQKDNHEL